MRSWRRARIWINILTKRFGAAIRNADPRRPEVWTARLRALSLMRWLRSARRASNAECRRAGPARKEFARSGAERELAVIGVLPLLKKSGDPIGLDQSPDSAAETRSEGGRGTGTKSQGGTHKLAGFRDLVSERVFSARLRLVGQVSEFDEVASRQSIGSLGNDLCAFQMKLLKAIEKNLG